MPVYQFAVKRSSDQDPDILWTHLADADAARRYANLLIKEFVSSGRYSHVSRPHLEVKDDAGGLLLSIPIQQFRF
jgi:hypothetical protein